MMKSPEEGCTLDLEHISVHVAKGCLHIQGHQFMIVCALERIFLHYLPDKMR